MKNKILAAILAAATVFAFGGCFGSEEQPSDGSSSAVPEEELVLYHGSAELNPMLTALAEEYTSSTGKKLTVKQGGSDLLGELKSQGGALFAADSHGDLSQWHESGMFSDRMNTVGLSSLPGVPAGLQLNPAGIGSYGLPLALTGYGLLVDKDLLSTLFEESAEKLTDDLKACSFTEFEGFVAAVDSYISAPSAAKVTVNKNEYTFKAEKAGKANSLTGVFAMENESTRAMEVLLSTALAAVYPGRYEVLTADDAAVGKMSTVLNAYTEALDLMSTHMAGAEGGIGRGDEFTGGDYNYSTSVDLFARNYALFYPGSTAMAADFEKAVPGSSANLDIIPMKLPLSDEQITAPGMTAEKLQSSIVIGSRYYLGVNPKAEETLSTAAKDFLNWLSSEAGAKAYSSAFGGVPYNFSYLSSTESGDSSSSQSTESDMSTEENSSGENMSSESAAKSKMSKAIGKSAAAPSESAAEQSSGADAESGEYNPQTALPGKPSHQTKTSLDGALAQYYAEGDWLPDLAASLPADFAEEVLNKGLGDYWGMETWNEKTRGDFVATIMSGWKELINDAETAVG